MKYRNTSLSIGAIGIAVIGGMGLPTHAAVTQLAVFQAQYYTQTGANTVTIDTKGYNFDTRIFSANQNDVGTAALSVPNSSVTYTLPAAGYVNGEGYSNDYNSGYLDSPTNLTSADPSFPYGAYTVNYSGGTAGTGSVSLDYTTTAYSTDTPQYSAATYNALQGMNASQSQTINWNTFTTGSTANTNLIYLSIYDNTTSTYAFTTSFTDPSTTSAFLPANTLAANNSYSAFLDFSNRIQSTNANNQFLVQGFDQTTAEYFKTSAAPEPSEVGMLALIGIGLGGLLLKARLHRFSS